MAENWIDRFKRLWGVDSLKTKEMVRMKLIAGLGNPGTEYDGTRHNAGYMVLDALAETFGVPIKRRKFNALTAEVSRADEKLLLLKPQQFMNRSGHSIATAAGFYQLAPTNVLVVTDDMALPVGQLRLRPKGSAGGHNGLKDIITAMGTDQFPRLRVGIGPSGQRDAADYVLSRFSSEERRVIEQAVATAVQAVLCWAADGIETAMTRYNVRAATDPDGQDVSN